MYKSLQLVSRIASSGTLTVELVQIEVPDPAAGEVTVKVEAAPINPTDISLMFGPTNIADLEQSGDGENLSLIGSVVPAAVRFNQMRVDVDLPTGVEGAGTVVATGPDSGHLLGKRVAFLASGSHGQFKNVLTKYCLVLPDDVETSAAAGAFVNPLTALGMIEKIRQLNQTALVHTAAASNLGRILLRCCQEEEFDLVCVVRRPEQTKLLEAMGAKHVVDSSQDDFRQKLVAAMAETGARTAFDAIGGKMTGLLLANMEMAARAQMTTFSTYGSSEMKRAYVYGALDVTPIEVPRTVGMSWECGGWLLFNFLSELDGRARARLYTRVSDGLNSVFKSEFAETISLQDAVKLDVAKGYSSRATDKKYLIKPFQA